MGSMQCQSAERHAGLSGPLAGCVRHKVSNTWLLTERLGVRNPSGEPNISHFEILSALLVNGAPQRRRSPMGGEPIHVNVDEHSSQNDIRYAYFSTRGVWLSASAITLRFTTRRITSSAAFHSNRAGRLHLPL